MQRCLREDSDWGLHRDEYRHATHRIDVEVDVMSVMDWGMLGYSLAMWSENVFRFSSVGMVSPT